MGELGGSLERDHQEVHCVHCPGDRQEPQRRQRLGRSWGPGPAAPPAPGRRAALRLPPPLGGGEDPSRAALLPSPRSSGSSAVRRGWLAMLPGEDPPPAVPFPAPDQHARPVRPYPGTSGCPTAGLASTCPGSRAGARRPALPPPPPCSHAALFPVQQYSEGGTGGEHPAELPPGLGLRLRETIPGVLASCPLWDGPAPEEQRRHPFPCTSRDPGPHLAVSRRWRQQNQDGGMRGEEAFSPTAGQISLHCSTPPLSPTALP